MKSSKQFKASLLRNIKLNKPIWKNSYSLKPMTDETTWYPCREWVLCGFNFPLIKNMMRNKIYLILADTYMFGPLQKNIMPMYRRKYGIYGALVLQYLDARSYYWQSLPF